MGLNFSAHLSGGGTYRYSPISETDESNKKYRTLSYKKKIYCTGLISRVNQQLLIFTEIHEV